MPNFAVKKGKGNKIRLSRKLGAQQISEIRKLVRNGLSLRRVARETGVSYSTVHHYARCYARKQTRMNISVLDDCERGYIVGAFVGDGNRFVERKSGHYGVKFALDAKRDEEIAFFLRNLFVKSGKRVTFYTERTWFIMKVYSKRLLEFVSDFVSYVEYKGKKRKMLIGFESWTLAFKLGFISGLIDTDGYVHHNRRGTKHFGASITTMNEVLKGQLVNLFEGLGLTPKVYEIGPSKTSYSKKPTYIIKLNKLEFSKICRQLISIKHKQFHL